MKIELKGTTLCGSRELTFENNQIRGVNPATGEQLEPAYGECSPDVVSEMGELAYKAFQVYSGFSMKQRADFLEAIAANIEGAVEDIVERATAETGLPEGRIRGETARTTGQLRLFANLLKEGSWVDARIETAIPDRSPQPKPDLRFMHRPLGPVVVFCASNFPMAFSVAGGDTASALAAGCPVIVKAHHAHPGTAELVGRMILKACETCACPEGTFSLVYGSGRRVGTALVEHPRVRAAGFTGSRSGGRALFDAAAARSEPIPVYAEMSSINPVVLLPSALSSRAEEIATGLQGSATLGAGQFCTNPGLVFYDGNETFRDVFVEKMKDTAPACMLHKGIKETFTSGVKRFVDQAGVAALLQTDAEDNLAGPVVFEVNVKTFLNTPELHDEIFGPATLLVTYDSPEQLIEAAEAIEGQLTATIHGDSSDITENASLVEALQRKAGRLIFNQFPTGVDVCHAMVHGGPYPATTDGRSTSVGTAAIYRFTRLQAYQNWPNEALPAELQDGNPLNIWRLVDGAHLQ